ncbi:MAG: GAF domain-containing protein [Alphaproteobacteria bacterium]
MDAYSFRSRLDAFSRQQFHTDNDVYRTFLNIAIDRTESDFGYFHLYDEENGEIRLAVWSDTVMVRCTSAEDSHLSLARAGFWADCIRQRRTTVHNNVHQMQNGPNLPEGHIAFNHHMSAPVFRGRRIVAVIGFGNMDRPYTDDDIALLADLVPEGWAVAEERIAARHARNDAIKKSFENKTARESMAEMIVAIGRALELRDEYTSRHQENVAYICGRIGANMRMTSDEQFGLFLGASIHDIGKIAIPALLLNKPGKLHPAEINVIKLHPDYGGQMFENVNLPWPIGQMILQHHERMDGSGYPYGLTGDDICLEARIIAVADTFDAMAGDRPYRPARGREEALEVLKDGRGTLFDPYVVDSFLMCLASDPVLKSDKYG